MSKVYHVLWKRYANISTILASTIPGVRVVKAFARERYEISRFNELTYQVFTGEMNAARLGKSLPSDYDIYHLFRYYHYLACRRVANFPRRFKYWCPVYVSGIHDAILWTGAYTL